MRFMIFIFVLILCTVSVFALNPNAMKIAVYESANNIEVGQEFVAYFTYRNSGGPAEKGWVAPSFPGDSFQVMAAGSFHGLNTPIYRPGDMIGNKVAVDTTVNSYDDWRQGEQKTLWVRVKAKKSGRLCYNTRASLKQGSVYSRIPTSGPKDQQGFYVEKRCIDIKMPSPGTPQRSAVINPTVTQGKEFQLAFTYRNMQKPTWKGFISANFEDFEVVDAGSNNGLTARISEPGTMIYGNAETMGSDRRFLARNTVVDFYDDWRAYEMKTGWVTLKADTPGTHCYKLRAAMCNSQWECNRDPVSGPLDQQEYHTQEYCINVAPAPKATVRIGKNDWDTILVDGQVPANAYYQYVNGMRYYMVPDVSQTEHNFTVVPSKDEYEGYSEVRDVNNAKYMFYMSSRLKTILRVVVDGGAKNVVFLDGEEVCRTWSHAIPGASYVTYKNYCDLVGVEPGSHELEVNLQGHEPVKRTVYLERGRWHEQAFPVLEPRQYPLKVVSDRENVHVFTNPSTVTYQYQGSTYSEDSCDTALDADGKYSCVLHGIEGYVGEPKKQRVFASYPGYYDSYVDVDLSPDGLAVSELELPMTDRKGVQVFVFTVPYSDVFFEPLDGQDEDHCSSKHRGGEVCTFGGQLIYGHEPREFKRGRYNVTVRPSEIYNPSSFVVDIQDNMTIDARQHVGTLRSSLTVNTNVPASITISRRELFRDDGLQERRIPVKTCSDTDTCTATGLVDYSSGYVIQASAPGYNSAEESTRVDEDTVYDIELIDDSVQLEPLDFGPEQSEPEVEGFLFGESREIRTGLLLPFENINEFKIQGGWCYSDTMNCSDHRAVDWIPLDRNKEHFIYSASDGEVKKVVDGYGNIAKDYGWNVGICVKSQVGGDFGNYVIVEKDGMELLYAHFENNSIVVSEGESVVAGQKLGTLGNTGCSDAPHLHFQIDDQGVRVDPYGIEGAGGLYPDVLNGYDGECGEDHLWVSCPPMSKPDHDAYKDMSFDSFDPHVAYIGRETEFTITGENLEDLVLFVPTCDNLTKIVDTSTEQRWSCRFVVMEPHDITVEVKNRPKSEGGVLLKTYTLQVQEAETGGGGAW